MKVLHTVLPSDQFTNPFVDLQISHLPDPIDSSYFTWRSALLRRYDVVHFQWPEKLVSAGSTWKRRAKQTAFLAFICLLRIRRTGVVMTVHNLKAHEASSARERALLDRLFSMTHVFILLNDSETPLSIYCAADPEIMVIPHGNYSHLSNARAHSPTEPQLPFTYFGLIRDYKQVPRLINAFTENASVLSRSSLTVIGKPWSSALEQQVREASSSFAEVNLILDSVPEQELAELVSNTELVVLPYRDLYNSGAVIFALSMGTPVLVPRTKATESLEDEFGKTWVYLYDGSITGEILGEALDRSRLDTRRPFPDLKSRDWPRLGELYAEAYAIAAARRNNDSRRLRGSRAPL